MMTLQPEFKEKKDNTNYQSWMKEGVSLQNWKIVRNFSLITTSQMDKLFVGHKLWNLAEKTEKVKCILRK